MAASVRPKSAGDDVASWLRRSWGEPVIAVHGRCYDAAALPAFVALSGARLVGLVTYHVDGDALEVVSCDADPPGQGTGRALVAAVVGAARQQGLARVWCTTTNDNLPALGFWQAMGWRLTALRPGAVTQARQLKPSIPLTGHRGLPVRDELDLSLSLADPGELRPPGVG